MLRDITFAHPHNLYLFGLIPLMIIWYWRMQLRKRNYIRISGVEVFKHYKPTFRQRLSFIPLAARILCVAFIVIALARPQSSSRGQNITTEGISIMLALDISASMLAEDLRPNRIDAAKKVAMDFIEQRPNDLIGLVIFSGESFSQCPLTSDHSVLKNLMSEIKSGMLQDGTAIGEGLATAVARLKDSPTKSKVIILLTDGVNNAGSIAPVTAGEIAKTFGIRVYSIGAGTQGTAPYPFKTPFGIQYQNVPVEIDEAVLTKIANESDGKYFRATNTAKLKEIFKDIDRMEKTKVEVTEFRRKSEEFLPYALAAIAFFILEIVMRYTLLRSLP